METILSIWSNIRQSSFCCIGRKWSPILWELFCPLFKKMVSGGSLLVGLYSSKQLLWKAPSSTTLSLATLSSTFVRPSLLGLILFLLLKASLMILTCQTFFFSCFPYFCRLQFNFFLFNRLVLVEAFFVVGAGADHLLNRLSDFSF